MADEAAKAPAPEPVAAPAAGAPPPAEPPALPDIDRGTLLQLLDKHSDDPEFRKELRSHRTVAGIAGDLAQRRIEEDNQETARKAVEAAHEDMRKMAADDPLAFSERWLKADDVELVRRQQAGLRDTTRREFAEKIGGALRDLPEFSELTAQDVDTLSTELRGVAEDDVMGVFVKKATDLVAHKRAQKLSDASLQQRLAEEKKVWEREQADKQRQTRRAPSIQAPSSGNAQDEGEPADFYSSEWRAWDERQRKAGRGVYAAARR